MKKIIYLIAITAFFACTSDNSSKKRLEQSVILTEYTNTRVQNFEESLIKSLATNTDIEQFKKSLKENLLSKDEPLMVDLEKKMSKYNRAKSTYNPEVDTVLIVKMNELKNSIITFTPNESDDNEIIKQEFISHLNNEKTKFIDTISKQNDLTEIQKEILTSQAIYEVGVISVLSKYSEKLEQLNNVQKTKTGQQKATNGCNWWCQNKKAIVCSGISLGAAGCWVGVIYGCEPCINYCIALTISAVTCWGWQTW